MKLIKTSELVGAQLDYAVARALGKRPSMFIYQQDGELAKEHRYSSDWAQGGPIIEREFIDLNYDPEEGDWCATTRTERICGADGFGTTPLVAAMRCYVASKFGDAVEIPEELL